MILKKRRISIFGHIVYQSAVETLEQLAQGELSEGDWHGANYPKAILNVKTPLLESK